MESVYLTKDIASMPIVIDTGASRSISPHKSDFIEFKDHEMKIGTVNASSKVEGAGIIRWKVTDQNDVTSVIKTAAYYIPSTTICLYSPQYHFRESCGGSLKMDNVGLHLTLPHNRRKPAFSFPFNSINNLPMMLQSHHPHFTSAMFSACPSGDEIHAQSTSSIQSWKILLIICDFLCLVGSTNYENTTTSEPASNSSK